MCGREPTGTFQAAEGTRLRRFRFGSFEFTRSQLRSIAGRTSASIEKLANSTIARLERLDDSGEAIEAVEAATADWLEQISDELDTYESEIGSLLSQAGVD